MKRREVDIAILSDTHLGTFGASALPLLKYLRSIQPRCLILNGDIIDVWQFNKYYFPKEHIAVIQEILEFAKQGVPTYYLTGNHDDALRKFVSLSFQNIHLVDSMLLEIDDKTAWVFHGDAFDHSVGGAISRRIAKLGGRIYDWSVFFNRQLNKVLRTLKLKPVFISKKIKDSVKGAINKVNNFEQKAIELGIEKGYDYVICGHIHRPLMKRMTTEKGSIMYLNSGDWLENLTSLEYHNGKWNLFKYKEEEYPDFIPLEKRKNIEKQLLKNTMNPPVKVVIKNGEFVG